MLAYHPALDPYHAAFRMLRILSLSPTLTYETDRLRILDFYLAFPSLIDSIRVPPTLRSRRKRVTPPDNKYKFNGEPSFVFTQMRTLQEMALQLLASSGLVDRNTFQHGRVRVDLTKLSNDLQRSIEGRNALEAELVAFLVSDLAAIPLTGKDGLKHRTLLMEYRYDPV